MLRPDTLSAVALRLGIPLASAHRLVGRLVEVGALEVDEIVARAGRPMKRYRATSKAFFVPYAVEGRYLPNEVVRRLVEARIDEQIRGLTEAAREALGDHRAGEWGTVAYADRNGRLIVRADFAQGRTPRLLDDDTPAYLNFYLDDLRLDLRTAKKMQRELVGLIKRYKTAGCGTSSYTLSVVMAPTASRRQC